MKNATISHSFPVPDIGSVTSVYLDELKKISRDKVRLEKENNYLHEMIRLLKHQLYGRKSEKSQLTDDEFNQKLLFEELEKELDENPEEVEEIEIKSYKRNKKGSKKLPDSLPSHDEIHDIPDSDKVCGCGCQKRCIGEEVTEKLEMLPAYHWKLRIIRPKYACPDCEGVESEESVVTVAPMPVQLIPKSIATPSLMANIIVGKFCDSLPFYRQEKQFDRYGISISRSRMSDWTMKVGALCKPLVDLLKQSLLRGPLLNVDETQLQVLHEDGRESQTKSWMWVMRGGPPGQTGIYYHYSEHRNGATLSDLIENYRGVVQTDGYSGYNFLDRREGIIHVGCWAHVRRKFHDVIKPVEAKGKNKKRKPGKADEALSRIGKLYLIEKRCRDLRLTPEEVYQKRQEESRPIIEKFKEWLQKSALVTPPKSKLGEAINYALGQWHSLVRYLDEPVVGMDNNLAENAIRPFVIGRKNWLFFDQPEGAEAGAKLYSLIETAKANQLEPYSYLLYIFSKLPHIMTDDKKELEKLLPYTLTQEILTDYRNQYEKRIL